MLFLATLALFALVIPVARGADHQVTVGGIGILAYDPEFVTADPGDTVTFVFHQKNHTVTQSTLNSPCSPLADGFDSGFVPVPDNQTDRFTIAQFAVTDTNPVWVYCRQTGHCQQGMVFAINPGNNFDTFKNNAIGSANASSASTSAAAISTQPVSSASVITVTATVTVNGAAQTTTYTTDAAAATSTSPSSTSSASSSSSSGTSHVVTVGANGALEFSPNTLTANIGDKVTFQFMDKNHTATQSSFADPCTPLSESSTNGLTGFDSGFEPAVNVSVAPTFTITVNDSAPVWVYCRQTNPKSHCNAGMVFAINAPSSGNTFDAFLANAKNATNGATTGSTGSNGAVGGAHTAGALVAAVAVLAGALLQL